MAQWHGLAKLRLHTDETLSILDKLTSELGDQLRTFQKRTCSAFRTRELPGETRARSRRQTRLAEQRRKSQNGSGGKTSDCQPQGDVPARPSSSKSNKTNAFQKKPDARSKTFKLNTYKHHSLGDYVETIRRYGTVDSYSTESVSSIYTALYLKRTVVFYLNWCPGWTRTSHTKSKISADKQKTLHGAVGPHRTAPGTLAAHPGPLSENFKC